MSDLEQGDTTNERVVAVVALRESSLSTSWRCALGWIGLIIYLYVLRDVEFEHM